MNQQLAHGRSVLVVDDEELNRHLYGGLLGGAGYDVRLAVDGLDAIDQLEKAPPDVVLLDYTMPRLDGPGVLRWIRASAHAETPVVLLTASGEAEYVSSAFDAGADDYLLKPVNPRILLARIGSTIAARDSALRAKEAELREQREGELRAKLLTDLEEARAVQLSQLPSFPLRLNDAWFSGFVASCGHVGGDIVDVLTLADGTSVALLVDVAGHGTAAALVASSIRSELRFLLDSYPLEEALVHLGKRVLDDGAMRHVCVGIVAMRGSEFSIVNAGLPPIWVGTASAARLLVESSGPPPGLFEASAYAVTRGTLALGEVIALVSDGLTEPFGFADEVEKTIPRLLDGLRADTAPPPDMVAEAIHKLVIESGVNDPPDDATVLVVGRSR